MQWWVFYGRYRTARSWDRECVGMVKWNSPFLSDRSNREKWSSSKSGFSKLFWLDRIDPFSFRPNIPEILVEWIASYTLMPTWVHQPCTHYLRQKCRLKSTRYFRQKQIKTLIFGFKSTSPPFHRNSLFLVLLKSLIFLSEFTQPWPCSDSTKREKPGEHTQQTHKEHVIVKQFYWTQDMKSYVPLCWWAEDLFSTLQSFSIHK